MRSLNVNVSLTAILLLFTSFFAAAVAIAPSSYAVGNDINATICNGGNGAQLSITDPQNDTVVNQPTVTVRGTVSEATQIAITIDGQYASTLPLADNQTTYSTDVSLSQGTHTITLTANDICQTGDVAKSIVVTFEQIQKPSNGSITSTDIDGITVAGLDLSTGKPVKNPIALPEAPSVGPIKIITQVLDNIGIDATVQEGGVVKAIIRVVLTTVAAGAIIFGGIITPAFATITPSVEHLYRTNKHRFLLYGSLTIRLLSVPLLAIVYFL